MSRTDGPIKGSLAFTCQDIAESQVLISEPVTLSSAEWTIVERDGGTTFSGTVTTGNLGHKYVAFTLTAASGTATTGTRQNGPTKGMVAIQNITDAISTQILAEPFALSEANYALVMAGTVGFTAKMHVDELGHRFIDFSL